MQERMQNFFWRIVTSESVKHYPAGSPTNKFAKCLSLRGKFV